MSTQTTCLLCSLTVDSALRLGLESMARHHSYFLCFWPSAKCNWRPLVYGLSI